MTKNTLKVHQILDKFVQGVVKDLSNSLLVVGSAGTGKTEGILSSLKKLKLQENRHFKYLNSYSSPLEFYHLLEDVNELEKPRLLVLDDAEEFIHNKRILSLLRSSLWGNLEGKRIVHWISPRTENHSFEFNGKIIILLNELNLNNSLIRALISRGFFYNLKLTRQEISDLIQERAKVPYKNLSFKQRKKIANFLIEEGNKGKKLNLRTFPLAMNLFLLSPNHYQRLISELLSKNY